jgi:hypothetical protein
MKYLLIPLNIAVFFGYCWVMDKCIESNFGFFPGFPILITLTLMWITFIIFSIECFRKKI